MKGFLKQKEKRASNWFDFIIIARPKRRMTECGVVSIASMKEKKRRKREQKKKKKMMINKERGNRNNKD